MPDSTLTTLASRLTDGALAERLRTIADDVRSFKPAERGAFLAEAADRLIRAYEANLYSVTYTPDAIRDSVDTYENDDPIKIAVTNANDTELLEVADMIIGSDPVWEDFHENINMCVREKFGL